MKLFQSIKFFGVLLISTTAIPLVRRRNWEMELDYFLERSPRKIPPQEATIPPAVSVHNSTIFDNMRKRPDKVIIAIICISSLLFWFSSHLYKYLKKEFKKHREAKRNARIERVLATMEKYAKSSRFCQSHSLPTKKYRVNRR